MQTAVDCNGINNSKATISTTTTAIIMEDKNDSTKEHNDIQTATVTLIPASVMTASPSKSIMNKNVMQERDSLNVLRKRHNHNQNHHQNNSGSKTTKQNSNDNIDLVQKNGCIIPASNTVANSTQKPQAMPMTNTNKIIVMEPRLGELVIDSAGIMKTTPTAPFTNLDITADMKYLSVNNNSSSSSETTSSSNSATSSVIASPILARNIDKVTSLDNVAADKDCKDNNFLKQQKEYSIEKLKETPSTIPLVDKDLNVNSLNVAMQTSLSNSQSNNPTKLALKSSSTISITPPFRSCATTPASCNSSPTITTMSPTKSLDEQLLQWKDMPEYLQFNPYVLNGYRPLQTFKGCLLSLFYWHNETINILTHAIPIVYILAIVPGLMPWEKGYRFLSFCHVFGSVAPWCGSFVYHLFMNIEKGENVYYRLLKLDMVGIWVSQSFGAMPLVTATTLCFSTKWKWFIIISYCLLSFWGLYKALTASSPWQRRLCFALPFTMRSILTFLRTIGLVGGSRMALSHVYLQDGVSILGGAIGAMRIPEKWFPGLVDFYLNSHNIMHVLVVVAVYSMHKATLKDFEWMASTNCATFNNSTSQAIDDSLNSNTEL